MFGYPDKIDAVDYPKAPLDSYKKIAKALDNSIIDSVSIEDAHRYNDLPLLSDYEHTKIFGVVKLLVQLKLKKKLKNRINESLKYISRATNFSSRLWAWTFI